MIKDQVRRIYPEENAGAIQARGQTGIKETTSEEQDRDHRS